ncbi:MAG TPA: MBL fold metallo-hydrolase [Syntrophales bacterium]|jgi:glyoxylase-like metal-dependent hydrolase (beta-lactamase superfamily II)|nr:MBL fold metallo-hydrolase [Syntrophales bacterium]HPX55718.1 MBL fold metallo-hydrolase [Syntrophales bacterium]HQA82925.1 MBL fold metallo-hydrolase [Syntrophales bacterium]
MFLKQVEVSPMVVFAYIVGDPASGKGLVIDPADDVDYLIGLAGDNGIQIDYIVNTHGHVDHISGNREMKEKTGASIIIHELDAPMLGNTPPVMLRMFGATQSPPADRTVRDGDLITVGAVSLRVLHTPGHTPGGMVLYADGFVFTGDTLFVEAVGRTDLPGGSWPVMHRSIKEKIFTLPDETRVLPGHNYGRMPTSTIGHEKKYNPYVQ